MSNVDVTENWAHLFTKPAKWVNHRLQHVIIKQMQVKKSFNNNNNNPAFSLEY